MWPYDDKWPPTEPPNLDAAAKAYRIGRYQRVRTLLECKTVLAGHARIVASLEITDKWYSAPGGRIRSLSPGESSCGWHSVLLVGYDDHKSELRFKNSWGKDWGDHGFGYISYERFEASWCEGWLQELAWCQLPFRPTTEFKKHAWGIAEHGGGVFHCREAVNSEDEGIAWAFAVERDGGIEVEELFVRPKFRRRGYGKKLIRAMRDLAAQKGGDLRVWISFADDTPSNIRIIEKLIRPVRLRLKRTNTRWAPLIAIPEPEAPSGRYLSSSPDDTRPRSPFFEGCRNQGRRRVGPSKPRLGEVSYRRDEEQLRAHGWELPYVQRNQRSARTNDTPPQTTSTSSRPDWEASVAPSNMVARSASLRAVRGRAFMKGWVIAGNLW